MTTFELTQAFCYPAKRVYKMLTDIESYPRYMKNIDKVTVLSHADSQAQSQWEATLDGKKIVWIEEDVMDAGECTISYRLVEGDLSEMAGCWQVTESEAGCTVSLKVSFAFANPMLAMFVEPILKRKLEENSQMLLDAIEAEFGKE